MSVNYPSYFTESLYGIIPAGRPFSEGRFYIISISIIFNLLWCEEWGQHKDPHKAAGARHWGTWQGPLGCVKEWVFHQKDVAANSHPRRMETHPKKSSLINFAKLGWSRINVAERFLPQSSVASAMVGRRRDTWPHNLPCMHLLVLICRAKVQTQQRFSLCGKPHAVTSTSAAQRSHQHKSHLWSTETSVLMQTHFGKVRAGRWWGQLTHGDVG